MIRFSTYRLHELSPSQRTATLNFLDSCDEASAYQFPHAGSSNELLLQLERDGELCFSGRVSLGYAASRLLPAFKVLTFNRGPVARSDADWCEGLAHVEHWARQQNLLSIKVLPYCIAELGEQRLATLQKAGWLIAKEPPRYTLRTPLLNSDEERFTQLPKDCRYKIKRAQREGITISHASCSEDLQIFIQLYQQMTEHKGIAATNAAFFTDLWQLQLAEPQRLAVLIARHGAEPLGANLIFRSSTRAEYLFGAVTRHSTVLHGDLTAGYPLQWAGMQWAHAAGCHLYDFGGFDPLARGGPAHMKKSFFHTASPIEFCRSATLELRPKLLRFINKVQQPLTRRNSNAKAKHE
jgi:hypothetical protein